MRPLTHVDLFSGIGGFALAARWAGFETKCFSEIDPYSSAVLRKHWPDMPNVGDITKADFGPYAGATLLTGGFPCQPFSCAGKQRGKEDDRFLWPAMLGAIATVKPTWIVGENVSGIIRMELDRVLADLEGQGYTAFPLVIPAVAVDARHRRDRVWIVAHANGSQRGASEHGARGAEPRQDSRREEAASLAGIGRQVLANSEGLGLGEVRGRPQGQGGHADECGEAMAAADTERLPEPESEPGKTRAGGTSVGTRATGHCRWPAEPGVGRVVNGLSRRVDRIKGLGNAIVPAVAFQILKAIEALESKN